MFVAFSFSSSRLTKQSESNNATKVSKLFYQTSQKTSHVLEKNRIYKADQAKLLRKHLLQSELSACAIM